MRRTTLTLLICAVLGVLPGLGGLTTPVVAAPAWDRSSPLGSSCPTNGLFGFASGGITICRGKRVVFAAPWDIPAAPQAGYTSRPSWYPTLAQVFPSRTPVVRDCTKNPVRFTSMIVPSNQLDTIVPYGGMFTTHVTPTDHAYVGVRPQGIPPAERTDKDFIPVMAPAAGRVVELFPGYRITIDHGCGVYSVFMVVDRLAGPLASFAAPLASSGFISPGTQVKAGQVIGRQRDHSIDFNVFASTTWLRGLANPYSYAFGEPWKPYTADPRPYFTEPLRALFTSKLQRTTEPRINRIDHDVRGTAAGSWFMDGTIGYNGRLIADVARSADASVITKPLTGKACSCWGHLSIARHWVDPTAWILSIGSWTSLDGSDADQRMLRLSPGQPRPNQITTASGTVVYQIASPMRVDPAGWVPGPPGAPDPIGYRLTPGPGTMGLVALRVNDDGTLAMELDFAHTEIADFTGFSVAKRTYHR